MYRDLIWVFIYVYSHNIVHVCFYLPHTIFFILTFSLSFFFIIIYFPFQNNIAEVKELHSELMWKDFIDHISKLLHSVEVEVSYFAAGIIAHLISRGEQAWTLSRSQRTSLLEQLVQKWWWILSQSFLFLFQCLYLTILVLYFTAYCHFELANPRMWDGGLQVTIVLSCDQELGEKKHTTYLLYLIFAGSCLKWVLDAADQPLNVYQCLL